MNTIITFSIKKDQLIESMISTLITYCFHRTVYSQIFSILNRSVKKKDFYLPFKTNKEILQAIGKTDKRTEQALTDIKKAGLLLKHNKQLVLHPLVYTRKSYSDRLENIIHYYYILFGQNTFDKYNIPVAFNNSELDFKQVKLDAIREYKLSPSLQDKKEQIMLNELDDYFNGTNITPFLSDEELETHITANENSVYELYQSIFVDSTVPSHQRSLKRSTTQRYRSKLSSYARTLLELHIEIFSEQNLVKHNSGVEYDFYRITTKSQKYLIDYKKTSVYKKITSPVENKQELDLFKNARPVSEIIEEIKQQEKLTAPVNITNEINPIEGEVEESLPNYLIEEPDFITHSVKTVQGELEYRVSTNTNNKSMCHLPNNYYEEYNKQQKLELERELAEIDKRYQEHINSLNQHKLNKMFEEYNKSHRIEVQLTPPLAHRIYPNCSLQDADLSRELYYNLS